MLNIHTKICMINLKHKQQQQKTCITTYDNLKFKFQVKLQSLYDTKDDAHNWLKTTATTAIAK